jgi:type IV pilus assembly protein PilA
MERLLLTQLNGRSMNSVMRNRFQRGFTLVELMAVVVMVAVLATLAVYGVRKYIFAAKASEAYTMINAIKAAEEAYRDETFVYLNVSGSLDSLYPNATPGNTKTHWDNPSGNDYANWQALGVDSTTAVQFGYAVQAGAAGATPPNVGTTEQNFTWPTPTEPWYVIKAVGDRDEDGVKAIVVAHSFSSEVYVEREDE